MMASKRLALRLRWAIPSFSLPQVRPSRTPRNEVPSFAPMRFAHQIPRPPPPQTRKPGGESKPESQDTGSGSGSGPQPQGIMTGKPYRQPHYELTFTCLACNHRSSHNISKQGYHFGSVLIACPSCRNRHVISDHLGIFGSDHKTIEDILREKGQLVKKGTLGEDGDLEFWADGSVTSRTARGEIPTERKNSALPAEQQAAAPGSTFKTAKKVEETAETPKRWGTFVTRGPDGDK